MWGMNEMWRRMVRSLFLCALLFLSCWGQDTTVPPNSTPLLNATEAQNTTINTSDNSPVTAGPVASSNPADVEANSVSSLPVDSQSDHKAPESQKPVSGSEPPSEAGKQPDSPKTPEKNSPTVLIAVLLTGLVIMAAIIGVYMWKNHCHTNAKGMKLTDESCVVDEENQGNTLVSVAPLTSPEAQEKPSQNGESPEGVKNQTPPTTTNGHSAAKTADTEL